MEGLTERALMSAEDGHEETAWLHHGWSCHCLGCALCVGALAGSGACMSETGGPWHVHGGGPCTAGDMPLLMQLWRQFMEGEALSWSPFPVFT